MNRLRSTTAAIIALVVCIALLLAGLIVNGIRLRSVGERLDMTEEALLSALTVEVVEEVPEVDAEQAEPLFAFPIFLADFRRFTSPTGERDDPLAGGVGGYNLTDHTGIDIATVWRARVVAVADGVVSEHWPPPDDYWRGHDVYGGMITITHDDGYQTLYAHLSSTRVHTGDQVRTGDVIGRVGDTGQTTGAHLHLELINPEGEHVNPLVYLEVPDGSI